MHVKQSQKQIQYLQYLLFIILALISSCQSAKKSNSAAKDANTVKGPPRFSLEKLGEQGQQAEIEIPLNTTWQNTTWKIYLPNDAVAEEHQAIVDEMQAKRLATLKPLFFATNGQFHAQTEYLINDSPDAELKAFVYYLKRVAYANVNRAKDLGSMETDSGIRGRLLQYQIGKEVYFELIYQIDSLFLRTIISTPLSNYQNLEEFNAAREYIAMLLKGISLLPREEV